MEKTTRVGGTAIEVQPPGSAYFGRFIGETRDTPKDEIDEYLQTLDAHKGEWAQLEISQRLRLLDEVREELWALRDVWVETEIEAKEIRAGTFGVAEEWVILAQVLRTIRQIQTTLIDIQKRGKPVIRGGVSSGPGGRTVLNVFPQDVWDRLIFQGTKGRVWLEPGFSGDDVFEVKAARYHDLDYPGGVAMVLGAGNGGMLPFCDAFHKLFLDLQVVILKLNPVNAHLGPMIEKSLQAFIRRGFLAVVYGGADVGDYVCRHPLVDEIHMTGSDKTYEAIVFGTGVEGRRRKLEKRPQNTKPFTCELGNVSPLIVVPGPWTQSDIDEYAKHVATWLVVNAGFACLTPRVVIQHEDWPERTRFLDAIKRELSRCPTRKAYYPGAFELHREFVSQHSDAEMFGSPADGELPWTMIHADPEIADDICFRREGFGSLYAEVSLPGESTVEFLENAVEFANDTLWGSLCAILLVHPKTYQQPGAGDAIESAIAALRYGTVAVNMLAFYSTYFSVCPWGAIPGHDMYDIQSGVGRNFNYLFLDHVEKAVVTAPFRRIDPLTIRSKRAHVFARKLAGFEKAPSWLKLVDLLITALKS